MWNQPIRTYHTTFSVLTARTALSQKAILYGIEVLLTMGTRCLAMSGLLLRKPQLGVARRRRPHLPAVVTCLVSRFIFYYAIYHSGSFHFSVSIYSTTVELCCLARSSRRSSTGPLGRMPSTGRVRAEVPEVVDTEARGKENVTISH